MSDRPAYPRVLIKLSGEALCPPGGRGIDGAAVSTLVGELRTVIDRGVQVALVIGGGNILRGRDLSDNAHIQRTTRDYMGMLATVMNALAVRDSLISAGVDAMALSAIPMPPACEGFHRGRAVEALEAGRVVLLAAGTGSPFFTTDTCAALRACELDADLLIKATKVDGVYDADPAVHPDATRYEHLTYHKVIADQLGVMDLTAVSMCMDNRLPVVVCQVTRAGNLLRAVHGESVGTTIGEN
jgi:uridylate kinase